MVAHRSRRWALALTPIAFFMVALDALVVITALPAIHRDLGAGLSTLEWTVNACTLAYAAGIITAAALGDRFGRRRMFAIGLVLFSTASAACALAPTAGLLTLVGSAQATESSTAAATPVPTSTLATIWTTGLVPSALSTSGIAMPSSTVSRNPTIAASVKTMDSSTWTT